MRIVKFSLVGAIGIGVQLTVLALLTYTHVNYLTATACAVEAAVLHNFVWHLRFTWRDRKCAPWWLRFVRFHISNGAISLIGNVALMRILVTAGMHVVIANVLAIALCALVNYLSSDLWVFAVSRHSPSDLET